MISSTYYEHLYAAHIVDKYMKYVNMTITIPKELKERMRKVENVNWSEVARKAFEEELRRIERSKAVEEIDKLRRESKVKWNGAREVRKWRDSR